MISSPGVGSGLDINSIISQLMVLEGQRLDTMQNKQSVREAELSNIGVIKDLTGTFKEKSTALSDIANDNYYKITSSDETKLTASTNTSTSSLGNYNVSITQLAQAHKLSSNAFSDKTASIGDTGTVSIQVGSDSFEITIDANNDTLEGVRDTINNASDNTGVLASILSVNDISGNPEYHLVLTSSNTGASNSISLTDVSGTVASTLNVTNEIDAAQDAKLTVDGFNVERSSNTITDAIEGLTLNLKSADATPLTLNVVNDNELRNEKIGEKVTEFVDAYNKIIETIDNAFASTRDTSMSLVKSRLLNVTTTGANLSGPFSLLADIGIKTDIATKQVSVNGVEYTESGKLKLDSTELNNMLSTNFDDVVALLNDSTEGFISRFETAVDQILDTDGIIDTREDSLNDQIKYFDDRIFNEESRLEDVEANLLLQYSKLDTVLAQLSSTSTFLAQQLESLSFSYNNSSSDN